jgi:hypothetical protein
VAVICIVVAGACLVIALLIKLTTVGRLLPGPQPINWLKLTDTGLLFSIALSLWYIAGKK